MLLRPLLRSLLQRLLGLANLLQPRLPALQLLGQFVARLLGPVARVLRRVDCFGFGQHLLHLGRQLWLAVLDPPVTHGLVLGGVGLHLRAVERHPTQLHRPALERHPQHLLEQPLEGFQVDLAKIRDRAEVGLVAGRQHAKGYVLDQPPGDPARGAHAQAIAVEQQFDHQPRMIRRLPALLPFIDLLDGRQIQLINEVVDEIDEVVFGQPILQTGRQQQFLLGKVGPVGFAHKPLSPTFVFSPRR